MILLYDIIGDIKYLGKFRMSKEARFCGKFDQNIKIVLKNK